MVSLEPEYVPLERSYKKIILQKFEVGKELEKNFRKQLLLRKHNHERTFGKNAAPVIEKTRSELVKRSKRAYRQKYASQP